MKNTNTTRKTFLEMFLSILLSIIQFSLAAIVMVSIWNDRIFVFGEDLFGEGIALGLAIPSMLFLINAGVETLEGIGNEK